MCDTTQKTDLEGIFSEIKEQNKGIIPDTWNINDFLRNTDIYLSMNWYKEDGGSSHVSKINTFIDSIISYPSQSNDLHSCISIPLFQFMIEKYKSLIDMSRLMYHIILWSNDACFTYMIDSQTYDIRQNGCATAMFIKAITRICPNINIIRMCLENGADISYNNNYPIRILIDSGHASVDVLQCLVKYGLDLQTCDNDILENIVVHCPLDFIKYFDERNHIVITNKDKIDYIYDSCCRSGEYDIIMYLHSHGCIDKNYRPAEINRMIEEGINFGRSFELVQYLIELFHIEDEGTIHTFMEKCLHAICVRQSFKSMPSEFLNNIKTYHIEILKYLESKMEKKYKYNARQLHAIRVY